jgi:hypothetical protein
MRSCASARCATKTRRTNGSAGARVLRKGASQVIELYAAEA